MTTPKLGPKITVSFIVFLIALKIDVKIVWFGCQKAVCVGVVDFKSLTLAVDCLSF